MIGYVTLGTNDIDRARSFYDALLGTIGASRLMTLPEGFTMYGRSWQEPSVVITPPYDGERAVPGNGTMTALMLDSREAVETFYGKALELGAADEGAPGLRGSEDMGFYAAYFRDLDGNKLAAFHVHIPTL